MTSNKKTLNLLIKNKKLTNDHHRNMNLNSIVSPVSVPVSHNIESMSLSSYHLHHRHHSTLNEISNENTSNNNILNLLIEFKKLTNDTINHLKEKKEEIDNYKIISNVVKTIGTTASVGGSILTIGALILAPITGGASIVVATGVGAAVTVGGTAVNFGCDIVDIFASKEFVNLIKETVEKRNNLGALVNEEMEKIMMDADLLMKKGFSEDESLYISFKASLKGLGALELGKELKRIGDVLRIGENITNITFRNGGQIWKGMRLNSEFLLKTVRNLGFRIGKKTAMTVVRTGTIVLNAAFAIWDISSLIDSWSNNHPTSDAVLNLVKDLEKQVVEIEGLIDYLNDN